MQARPPKSALLFVSVALAGGGIACSALTSLDDLNRTDATSADSAGEDVPVATSGDFCDAEALFVKQCGCSDELLANCGSFYTSVVPELSHALTTCANTGELPCGGSWASLLTSVCVTEKLSGFTNDSGAFAKLTGDFCVMCADASACSTFAQPGNPGYRPSLLNDSLVTAIDNGCAPNDASACAKFTVCSDIAIAVSVPPIGCGDGGAG